MRLNCSSPLMLSSRKLNLLRQLVIEDEKVNNQGKFSFQLLEHRLAFIGTIPFLHTFKFQDCDLKCAKSKTIYPPHQESQHLFDSTQLIEPVQSLPIKTELSDTFPSWPAEPFGRKALGSL